MSIKILMSSLVLSIVNDCSVLLVGLPASIQIPSIDLSENASLLCIIFLAIQKSYEYIFINVCPEIVAYPSNEYIFINV